MSYFNRIAFCVVVFLFSLSVQAECGRLQVNKGFDVVFRITNVQHQERVILTGQNDNKKILWSNVPGDSAVINDSDYGWTVKGQHYDIWLHYIPGKGNKPGALEYYFYRWDLTPQRWGRAMVKNPAYIFGLSNNVYVSGQNTEILNCNGTIEPLPEPKHCDLFPGPVQTWKGNANNLITMDKGTQINNTDEYKIGFSNQIVNRYTSGEYKPPEQLQGALCDGKPCELNGKEALKKILNWNSSGASQSLDNIVIKDERQAIPGTYFYAARGWTFGLTVEPGGNLILPSGEYWVDAADIRGKLTIKGQVTLHILDTLSIGGAVNTSSPADNLTVFAYNSGNACPLPANYPAGPPQVATNYSVDLNVSGQFNGRIYSQGPVTLSNSTTLVGAVTACQLQLSNTAKIIGDSECFTPQPKDVLDIMPQQAFGLTCERMPVSFSVRKKDGTLNSDYSGTLNASVTSDNPAKSCWALSKDATRCTSEAIASPLSGGQRTLWLESKKVGDIMIEGSINDLSDSAGPYRFSPYGFRINRGNPVSLVAGKPDRVLVEVVADTGKGCETIKDYSEEAPGALKKLSFQSLSYVRPTTRNHGVEIDNMTLSAGEKQEHDLTFINGWAWLPVKYHDAGEISFELVDKAWQPKECDNSIVDCEDFERDWQGLAGKAVIHSRPYTFAMCNIQSKSGNADFFGTATAGNAFTKAGEAFSVTFKPVIWSSVLARRSADFSGDNNADIITTDSVWCREEQSTPNYYSVADEITAPMVLSHKLATPVGGEQGLLQGSGTYHFANTQEARDGLTLNNLNWSEVGSLWLQADATYLGMDVEQGVGGVGRFYPHHFALLSSQLKNAVADKFTYMDQAFSASFKVEARNKDEIATLNYSGFASGFLEALDLVAADANVTGTAKNELTPRLDKTGLFSGWDKATLEVSNRAVGFKRDVTKATPKTTIPDGPYDVALGLIVSRGPSGNCRDLGCTDFAVKDLDVRTSAGKDPIAAKVLAGNIHARYGRLKLEDVNTQFDKPVNIPLRAEYWDSVVQAFVLNTDDAISHFNGNSYCKQIIWPTSLDESAKSKSYTQGNGSVKSGESYMLEATPDRTDYFREQVRFWQRLTASQPIKKNNSDSTINCFGMYSNQPWLTYNWRGKGDEDPSAVVTFGVYRGNDRIIYRGEKGINK
ncbi:DUF6701 domain-containing protein [uncultured Photobacterium sp.]|uniref:DUF6701 domain-containing protein n=1 Tax=uncultured Photobacterium sp. TaxID=173973 RepID=UPI00263911CA|nr:DUF6701 domain-containing protein [uncultured Photobacterium sp.]